MGDAIRLHDTIIDGSQRTPDTGSGRILRRNYKREKTRSQVSWHMSVPIKMKNENIFIVRKQLKFFLRRITFALS